MSHVTAAQPGKGTTLGYGTTSAGPFTPVALRTSIEGPSIDKEKVEKTDLDSTIVEYRDSGLPEIGEISLNIWWDPGDTGHEQCEADASGVAPVRFWQIGYQDSKQTQAVFSGWVKGFEKSSIEPKSNLAAKVTIVPTSAITYTYVNPTG